MTISPPQCGSIVRKDLSSSMKNPLVLCVDDDEGIRGFYGTLLEYGGYDVLSAGNGQQALDLFHSTDQAVDVAIVDYELPGMNGFELAVRLKLRQPRLPILMISALTPEVEEMSPFVDAAIEKGAPNREILEQLE